MSIFVRMLCVVSLTLAVSTVAATGQAEAPGPSEKPATSTEPSPPAESSPATPAPDAVKQPPGDSAARLPQVVVTPGARPQSPQPQSRPSTTVSAPSLASRTAAPRRTRGTQGGGVANLPGPAQSEGSLTVRTAEQARKEIEQQTPGSVAVVPDTQYKNTPAQTIKDIVDYVAGVWAQPKWGDDTRLSIRGSGLSRNFHLRGIQLYMDGIPINTSDGYGDFQEIDPTAYRYVEVYKGANALRFGANSLGGAINFVVPSGRDASLLEGRVDSGAFGFWRGQASSGGANELADYFITGSSSRANGYREHSSGTAQHLNANFGYRIGPNVETRFYVNANEIRQHIPGEVTKYWALTTPKLAWTDNVVNDWQRNIDTVRLANKTTVRFGATTLEVGAFSVERHLMHPIFQWLDYTYHDYGGFSRVTDDRAVGPFRNIFIGGVNVLNGKIEAQQFQNIRGTKGMLMSDLTQRPQNYSGYLEDVLYIVPGFALVAGTQYLFAVRDQAVQFSLNGDLTGRNAWSLWSPKGGFLWDIDPSWQVYGNISRSAEVPSFGESVAPNFLQPTLPNIPWFGIHAQTATTYEIGTRGRRPDYTWDFAIYRAQIDYELMCFFSSFGNCNVTNADKTIHQGIEAAVGVTLFKYLFTYAAPDRIWLNLAYTVNDFRYYSDATFGNNLLPGAPLQYIRAELLYKHPSGFSFGPNIEWVPQAYYVDSANTLTSEPYLLWGVRAAYDDQRNLSWYIEGRNLGNKTYISSASIIDRATPLTRLFNPGIGQGVFGGVRARL
jgi:iron complex outermembrane recepter protein